MVFPTHVGVILIARYLPFSHLGIPHACGGDPSHKLGKQLLTPVFPTHVGVIPGMTYWSISQKTVFPTHVGVILTYKDFNEFEKCIPHVCEGSFT